MDRILLTAQHRREVNNSLILGNSIRVEIDGFIVQSHFAPCLREYDQNALNQIKRKGAIVNLKNHKKIQETLEALKAKYPGLPVQDNS